jgi:hypothetical protein
MIAKGPCQQVDGYEDFQWLRGDDTIALLGASATEMNRVTRLYVSRDHGGSWTAVEDGLPRNVTIDAATVDGGAVTIAAGDRIFKLDGTAWTELAAGGIPAGSTVRALAGAEGCLLAAVERSDAASNGVYVSCNAGRNFDLGATTPAPSTLSYNAVDKRIVLGTQIMGVFTMPAMLVQ